MIRLLWKDFRQRRTWALLVVLSAVGPILMGSGYTFVGQFRAFTPYIGLSAWLCFMMAASRKDIRDHRDFLHSRPVSFAQDALAGILIGLTTIIGAAVASALAFLVLHPDQYDPFVTSQRVAAGIGYAVLIMGVGYTAGSGPGLALSSKWGWSVVLVAVLAAELLRARVLAVQGARAFSGSPEVAWLLGGAVLALLALLFGRSLEPNKRFGVNVTAVVLVIIAAFKLNFVPEANTLHMYYKWSSVSPDGRYAIVQYLDAAARESEPRVAPSYLVDLNRHKGAKMQWPEGGVWGYDLHWTDAGTAYQYNERVLYTARMSAGHKLRFRTLRIKGGGSLRPSPDRSHVFLLVKNDDSRSELAVIDVETLRRTSIPINESPRMLYWQSNTEIHHIDNLKRPHSVNVPKAQKREAINSL